MTLGRNRDQRLGSDTALRDIEDLIRKDVLVKDAAGGRNTTYSLAETP